VGPPAERRGSTREREAAKKVAIARPVLAENAPPVDFAAPLDSLDIMEKVMRLVDQVRVVKYFLPPVGALFPGEFPESGASICNASSLPGAALRHSPFFLAGF
jgi:hypothetical protein